MSTKLYVGNLSFNLNDESLGEVFSQYGQVVSAKIIMDRMTGRSRGFGFVEMSSEEETEKALEGLNGQELLGRTLRISHAKEQQSRGPRTGGNRF